MKMKPVLQTTPSPNDDPAYQALERLVARRINEAKGPLFATDAAGLFDTYLGGLAPHMRQGYNCRTCQRFLEKYGSLVTISDRGLTQPLLWDHQDMPATFVQAAHWLARTVRQARVTGVFYDAAPVWGTPESNGWTHLHGIPAAPWRHAVESAEQAMAAKREDYAMLWRALSEFPAAAVVQAVRVLEADAVDRSEKTLGQAKWLLSLHETLVQTAVALRPNLVWKAVALAPAGWCHVRSSMIGTLLEDVVAGLPFEAIQRRWNEKMHPLQYQRPTAPLSAGQVQAANNLVEKVGSAGALFRRMARLTDVLNPWWTPRPIPAQPAGHGRPFDHLLPPSGVKEVILPARKLTWAQFREEVLPDALTIDIRLEPLPLPFFGLVTAVNPEAPALLQWDGLAGQARNPASWYFYNGGSHPADWGLPAGAWLPVTALFARPCHWQEPEMFPHFTPALFISIEGARELRLVSGGSFFPECLRAEYHGVRAALEAYSRQQALQDRELGDANGLALEKGSGLTVRLRVRTATVTHQEYLLTYGE